MKPFIHSSFWSDPDIESAPAEIKLAALWLITNSQTTSIGICSVSPSRFSFETGLPQEALPRAIEALPRAFVKFGSAIFIRNFVRHQFGSGEQLTKNNFFRGLKSLFISIKDEGLKKAVLSEYPEFQDSDPKGFKGLPSPRKGKERTGQEGEIPEQLSEVAGFEDQWAKFVQHRKEIKKPMTPLAAKGVLNTLLQRPAESIFAIETAIRRSWQGIEWDWIDKEKPGGNGEKPKGDGMFLSR